MLPSNGEPGSEPACAPVLDSDCNAQIDVPAGNDFAAIAAGSHHCLALKTDGALVAWGGNQSGQSDVPAGNDYVAIAAGHVHSVAVKSDGSIVSWGCDGDYNYGQCNAPAGNNFTPISAGAYHSLALAS